MPLMMPGCPDIGKSAQPDQQSVIPHQRRTDSPTELVGPPGHGPDSRRWTEHRQPAAVDWDVRSGHIDRSPPVVDDAPDAEGEDAQPHHGEDTGEGDGVVAGEHRGVTGWVARPTPRRTGDAGEDQHAGGDQPELERPTPDLGRPVAQAPADRASLLTGRLRGAVPWRPGDRTARRRRGVNASPAVTRSSRARRAVGRSTPARWRGRCHGRTASGRGWGRRTRAWPDVAPGDLGSGRDDGKIVAVDGDATTRDAGFATLHCTDHLVVDSRRC